MQWETTTLWFTREKYEIRMVRPDLWILFAPDGYVDADTSLAAAKHLAETHFKDNPIPT